MSTPPPVSMFRVRLKGTDLWLAKQGFSTGLSEGFHPGEPFDQRWVREDRAKVFTRIRDLKGVVTRARSYARHHKDYDPTGPRLEIVYPNGVAVPLNDLCPEK